MLPVGGGRRGGNGEEGKYGINTMCTVYKWKNDIC
jgi:hypothetical protein